MSIEVDGENERLYIREIFQTAELERVGKQQQKELTTRGSGEEAYRWVAPVKMQRMQTDSLSDALKRDATRTGTHVGLILNAGYLQSHHPVAGTQLRMYTNAISKQNRQQSIYIHDSH